MTFDDATLAQIDAARPDASTWLGANAGSGKTRVLTDRVARLLLDGVRPQHILCLTYTKAAASEMQNRLFKRLGAWAMIGDTELRAALVELGVEGTLTDAQLRQARRLFALAIETPGGLKIQTIHSFCAALLRRFPLEAGVSPQFTEIEDRAADLLRAEIVDEMSGSGDRQLVADLAAFYTGEDFGRLTRDIVGKQSAFEDALTRGDFLATLGKSADLSLEQITAQVFQGGEQGLLDQMIPLLLEKGGNDEKAGRQLEEISDVSAIDLPLLERVFLTGASAKDPFTAKVGSFPTKATRERMGPNVDALNNFMLRVEDARDARLALLAAERATALSHFARAFLVRYQAAKVQRGWLDFDDLILKTRALLRDKADAAWVLYRIDGGIDHILVDEAQDTSPEQWEVIEALAEEFHSGEGARADTPRTLFVVGDKKQSIYSFQGADPREFDRKSQTFEEQFTAANLPFQQRSLDYSFRSSSAILRLVDTVFDPRRRPEFDKQSQHIAFKDMLPGRVDLWPLVEEADEPPDPEWTDPLDRLQGHNHNVRLAQDIANRIKELTDPDNPSFIADDGKEQGTIVQRPIRPGDFLILVQRRSTLFSEIIRACKAAGLPIAGADRLKVGAELAVKDLAALLSFLASPDDSLSLAVTLKSPLFGWDEQSLFDLAHRRTETHLWQALRGRKAEFPKTHALLTDLLGQVDFLRPYDLIERILIRHDGRRKLLARLGSEAEDGINELLTQALAYERNAIPSLTGFIEWMRTDDVEIKRQIDSASDQIRVMTVHGSKGLEAPIVILPDAGRRDIRIRDDILTLNGTPMWKPAAEDMPLPLRQRIDEMKDAEKAERLRLLYVAMTRAEKWLIVAAAGKLSKDGDDWYQIVEEAMGHVNAATDPHTGVRRFQERDWDALPKEAFPGRSAETLVLEPVFVEQPAVFSHALTPFNASQLGGAKALPSDLGEDADTVLAYGTFVHGLLEELPKTGASDRAALLVRLRVDLPTDIAARAKAEALAVLDAPHLTHLFAPGALAEVSVSADVAGLRLHGIIDQLLIDDTTVTIVDYKTNRHPPESPQDCPEGILRQMGAYAAILSQIYPEREIQTAILWTANATLMPLSHDAVTDALWRAPDLDGRRGGS